MIPTMGPAFEKSPLKFEQGGSTSLQSDSEAIGDHKFKMELKPSCKHEFQLGRHSN